MDPQGLLAKLETIGDALNYLMFNTVQEPDVAECHADISRLKVLLDSWKKQKEKIGYQ